MQNKKYSIAVIGPIPRDHITTYKGQEIDRYGCITHAVVALSKLLAAEATILPVSHIRKIDEKPIREILENLPGVDLSHLSSAQDRGDVISLRFIDQNERVKTMSAFMDPITTRDIKTLLECDAFLFLPVTDFEIAHETLKLIKAHSKGLVIFDAHGPTKTMSLLGDRLSKFWIDKDQWLPYIDILKMNLKEARCCWPKRRYASLEALEDDEPITHDELLKLAKHCFSLGVKALYVTSDVSGCMVFYAENGKIEEQVVKAIQVESNKAVDSTGCGDSFAGGLTYGLLTTNDYIEAAKYANALGAQCLTGTGFECFQSLQETKQMVEIAYSSTS